jgi:hypothetical protein
MARVRVASAPLWQVQLLKNALAEEGIDAEISGEALGGLTGALPIGAELPQLLVEEADVEAAKRVVREMNDVQAQTGARTCPKCGEESPANFERCWSCGATLDAPTATPVREEVSRSTPTNNTRGAPMWLTLVLALSTAVLGVLLWQARADNGWKEEHYGHWARFDKNCQQLLVRGHRRALICDFNDDSVFEIEKEFDTQERVTVVWRDENANALKESAQEFDDDGAPVAMNFDRDEDGRFEERHTFDSHGRVLTRWYLVNRDGVRERTETIGENGELLGETITRDDGSWTFTDLTTTSKRVWSAMDERRPAQTLTITLDGGVRTQHLTDLGWVDAP